VYVRRSCPRNRWNRGAIYSAVVAQPPDCTVHPVRRVLHLRQYIPHSVCILCIRVVPPGMGIGGPVCWRGPAPGCTPIFPPRPPPKTPAGGPNPHPGCKTRKSICSRQQRCVRFGARARLMELLVSLSASDKVRAHRFFVLSMPLKSVSSVFRQRASSLNDLYGLNAILRASVSWSCPYTMLSGCSSGGPSSGDNRTVLLFGHALHHVTFCHKKR
jgi:hypothetical protein